MTGCINIYPVSYTHLDVYKRQCQSRVWLQADDVDGKIVFKAESDALIVKGIIALLIKVFSGHTPDAVSYTHLDVYKRQE